MTLNSCRDPVKPLLSTVRWLRIGNIIMIKYKYTATNTNIGTQNTNTKAHTRRQIQRRCRDLVKLLLSSVRWPQPGNRCKLTMHSFVKLHFGWIAFKILRETTGEEFALRTYLALGTAFISKLLKELLRMSRLFTAKPLH